MVVYDTSHQSLSGELNPETCDEPVYMMFNTLRAVEGAGGRTTSIISFNNYKMCGSIPLILFLILPLNITLSYTVVISGLVESEMTHSVGWQISL